MPTSPSPRADARHRRRIRLGKSVTSYAVMRILTVPARSPKARYFPGIDVKAATENQMRDLRGAKSR